MQAGLGDLEGGSYSSFWETILFTNASKEMTEIAKRKLKSLAVGSIASLLFTKRKKSFKHFLLEVQESRKTQSD